MQPYLKYIGKFAPGNISPETYMPGIYIHIPFCKSRCTYCGFYSTTLLRLRGKYVDALCREMAMRKDYVSGPFTTVYLGGGTPSVLTNEEIKKLFYNLYKVYDITSDAEVTMECNPDDITPEMAGLIRSLPVNRVSMGAQTFADGRLKFLHRRHSAADVRRAVSLLRDAGIGNISIDLMFGFPKETIVEWQHDIDEALQLGVEHISAYSLMYEEGTPLDSLLKSGQVEEIDDCLSESMYRRLVKALADAGYEHYEISNFAKPGFRSLHNSSYWHQVPYIGLGAAAHSFDISSRQWNVSDINGYISAVSRGTVPMEREVLDTRTRVNDMITTALRTKEGMDLYFVEKRCGREYKEMLINSAKPHIDDGTMELRNNRLRITDKGIFISDSLMSDLIIL